MKRTQLLCSHDATQIKKQHIKPCSDCPFARKALPGWLAGQSVPWWLNVTHGDGRMECHTKLIGNKGAQCAGAAIFRANVVKWVSEPNLRLPKDIKTVFAWDDEFASHHEMRPITKKEIGMMKMTELFSHHPTHTPHF